MGWFTKRVGAPRAGRPTTSQGKRVRPQLEALNDRVAPSVTFQEDTAANTLTLTAAQNQNNTINIVSNGNGGLTVTADGVVRNFTDIDVVFADTGNGADTVTYNQGTATQNAHQRRDFSLYLELGDNAAGTLDRFTANVFGDVGFLQNGAWRPANMSFEIDGDGGRDRIDVNVNHDTDVRAGSRLGVQIDGFDGNDNITVDFDGELDGKLDLRVQGLGGNDTIAVNVQLDNGSRGKVYGSDHNHDGGGALVTGDFGNDTLRLAIRQAVGSQADVNALLDGGLGFFDHDVGRHTTNVRTAYLEEAIVIQ